MDGDVGGAPSGAPSRIRPATRGDMPEIVDLLCACDVAEVGEPDSTLEDLENDWSVDGFEPARDTWVAESPAGLVGYAYAGDEFRTGELEADVWVHPGHHEPELAGRLLGLAERRAARIAAERGYRDAWLDVFSGSDNRLKRDLLRRRGYALVRTVYRMTADLSAGVPAVVVPEGLEIRPFRLEADERPLYELMNEAFEDFFRQSREPFDAWRVRLFGHADFDPGLWWIAWDGEQAVGGLIAYDHGDLGWVKGLGVRRPWRRRGLGAALLARALAAFRERGQVRVDLGVDAEGATRPLRLYERAGLRATSAFELYTRRLDG
ncbi:MAG: putative acetyltransferase [Actinobacteria bacterium ADurb.BinA094]|nr:MAG: putative acetyltransferase [Actinobacteria bacterium ADurb.BinA094]